MSEKYIRKSANSYSVVRASKNYGKFPDLDDAIFIRDLLSENDWNPELIEGVHQIDGEYVAVRVIDDKIHILCKSEDKPSSKSIDKLYKRRLRNPNNSKYGLNITGVFDTYVIKKQIAGDAYVFGYYDNLEDAEFVRNHLMDHSWNVNEFSQIQYDEDSDTYKVIEVIDDKVYVLDSFKTRSEIDIDACREDFLLKISKHKYGLASHDHLGELTDKLDELEKKFNVSPKDDVWSFDGVKDPLNDIIFALTPFQKSVYDAVDDSTFEEIKKSLIRYKTRNFDEKINRCLDELISLNLISKKGDVYKRI